MASFTSRYARAFADVVLARAMNPDEIRGQLSNLLEVVRSSPELKRVWENPAVPPAQKKNLLDALSVRLGLAKETRNFAAVLIEHRRIAYMEPIFRQFEQELNQRLGIAEAEVASARELDAGERRSLEAQIGRMTGKKVQARYVTDPGLLGGAVVRMGSTIYDGSVRGQLEKMRETLSAE